MKLTITATSQFYLIDCAFRVFVDGEEVAWLGSGQSVALEVPCGTHTLFVKGSIREKEVTFTSQSDISITIKWNRMSGKIETLCTGPDVRLLDS